METTFRSYLQNELIRRCESNPGYSLRAFAKSLGYDPSALAKILSGTRPAGKKVILKLGSKLDLTPEELEEFVDAPVGASLGGATYQSIALDSFKVISDWYHYAILELMRLDSFKQDVRWISSALGIPVAQVRAAVERLQRIGMLKVDTQGKWADLSGGKSTTLGSPFTDAAFRNLQRQVLEGAIRAMNEVPISRRDQSSMTMAIDTERIPEAKAMIKEFRRKLARVLSRGEKRDQVYQMSVSLYPITQIK